MPVPTHTVAGQADPADPVEQEVAVHAEPDSGTSWDELAERLREANERIARIRVSAESEDGLVTATVDARGRLDALEIDPRVYRNTDSGALAERVLDAARAAAEQADRQVAECAVDAELMDRRGSDGLGPVLGELDRLLPGRERD